MTDKQELFCLEYLIDLNAAKSARRAGYSEDSAKSIGYELLGNPEISDKIATLMAERANKCQIKAERVLEEYAKIAFSDIRELYAVDNNLLDVRQMDDNTAAAVMSVEVDEIRAGELTIGYTKKVKLYNKLSALQDLGKHLGVFEKDNEQRKDVIQINVDNTDAKLGE